MKDRRLNSVEIVRQQLAIFQIAEQLGLPTKCLGVNREGLVVPIKPLVQHQGLFYDDPSVLGSSDRRSIKIGDAWYLLALNMAYLQNPNTPCGSKGDGVRDAARDVYHNGVLVSQMIPEVGIVIPDSPTHMTLKPDYTASKILNIPAGLFAYQVWVPRPLRRDETAFFLCLTPYDGKINIMNFTVQQE